MVKVHFVKCSTCGEKRFVNPQALQNRIKKYGSLKAIEKKWNCRNCDNKLKKQK